jgi:hypothetical protein
MCRSAYILVRSASRTREADNNVKNVRAPGKVT